jgi:hypothetical protein
MILLLLKPLGCSSLIVRCVTRYRLVFTVNLIATHCRILSMLYIHGRSFRSDGISRIIAPPTRTSTGDNISDVERRACSVKHIAKLVISLLPTERYRVQLGPAIWRLRKCGRSTWQTAITPRLRLSQLHLFSSTYNELLSTTLT